MKAIMILALTWFCAGASASQINLEPGVYSTGADFCKQTVAWQGEQLQLTIQAPCEGNLLMDKVRDGWYSGKVVGYDFVYELEVKSSTSYVFHSRSFAKSGEFTKEVEVQPTPQSLVPFGYDPTSL